MVDGGRVETHSLVCNVLGLLGWVAGTEPSLSALRKQLVDGKREHMLDEFGWVPGNEAEGEPGKGSLEAREDPRGGREWG